MKEERTAPGAHICAWCGDGIEGRPDEPASHTICQSCLELAQKTSEEEVAESDRPAPEPAREPDGNRG